MLVVLALAPWIVLLGTVLVRVRRSPRLADYGQPRSQNSPLVSIIIPARNEAMNIGACLATLLNSEYEEREIIVVDDESVDGTDSIVRALEERSEGTLRLIEGEPVPDGWLGKPWACWQGYQAARGEVLLFVDADTRHDSELLGRAVTALQAQGAAMVSVLPEHQLVSFWERVIMPHVLAMMTLRYPRGQLVNRASSARDVLANGQFIMVRRESYDQVGGHEAVRAEVVEDLRLAQRFVASGKKLFLAHAEEFMETRMYRSLAGIVEGWSKNIARGSRMSVDPWLRPAIPWLLVAFLIVYWVVPVVVLGAALVASVPSDVMIWALWAVILSLVFWLQSSLRVRVPPLYVVIYPLGALIMAGIVARSALRGRKVEWKGRTYRVPGRS